MPLDSSFSLSTADMKPMYKILKIKAEFGLLQVNLVDSQYG